MTLLPIQFPFSLVSALQPSAFLKKPQTLANLAVSLEDFLQKRNFENGSEIFKTKVILLGVPDERGVVVNGGHPGASQGPLQFRKNFYSLANSWHESLNQCIIDAGDIVLQPSISDTHENISSVVRFFIQHGAALVIVVGGGHDFSYGSYLGHAQSVSGVIPIINFDAHLDLRPPNLSQDLSCENINSGTPFYRIIENISGSIANGKALLEIGIQRTRNTKSLYEYATNKNVKVSEFDALTCSHRLFPSRESLNILEFTKDFFDSCSVFGWNKYQNQIHCSVDLDVFCQSIAPGTSASSPFGCTLKDIGPLLSFLSKNRLSKVLDIAELCPVRDVNGITAKLAASIADRFACDALEPLFKLS
jgi:formiminoglutamase